MDDPAMDPTLMPDFPGLSDAEHCREWDAGFPVDYELIDDKDEAYWSEYRGTPKAIINYAAGKALWGNRFGALTAIRVETDVDVQRIVKDSVDPSSVGFTFVDTRKHALEAASQSMDFGSLFLSMSFYLIVAAAILTGLLFVFGIEQRSREIGTLLAVGWLKPTIGRVLMMEGVLLAIVGSAAGCLLGVIYTRAILHALNSVWQDAVSSTTLQFHSQWSSIAIGFGASIVIAVVTMWMAMRKCLRQPAIELLTQQSRLQTQGGSPAVFSRWLAVISLFAAIIMLWLNREASAAKAAGAFFGVGALLLVSTIATCWVMMVGYSRLLTHGIMSLSDLAFRHATRRPQRSIAIVMLIACGSFMVIAVGANRQDMASQHHHSSISGGSGGFSLYGETALPLLYNLNTSQGRDAFAISEQDMQQVNAVSLRLRDGDDASCLNLNSAPTPRLLGIDPTKLTNRFGDIDWSILNESDGDTVAVIGDDATITWSLYKKVGDTIDYVAENGKHVKLRIAGVIPNSIFQGSLMMSESAFEQLFPSHSGYNILLFDAPGDKSRALAEKLSYSLSDLGLEVTPTGQRLAMFNRVQNTYLSIFAALGGLGLILGSIGLGAVVLRNIYERRSELATLSALGFTRRKLFGLILIEHGLLLETGLICGTLSAVVAVWPAIRSSLSEIPYVFLITLIIAIWLSGLVWVSLAALLSLRGSLIDALRSE
jgi:ABC-type antimicrobial peptide transport system permease subunit